MWLPLDDEADVIVQGKDAPTERGRRRPTSCRVRHCQQQRSKGAKSARLRPKELFSSSRSCCLLAPFWLPRPFRGQPQKPFFFWPLRPALAESPRPKAPKSLLNNYLFCATYVCSNKLDFCLLNLCFAGKTAPSSPLSDIQRSHATSK